MKPSDHIQAYVTIKFEDYIMRDHRVHGVRIMPGVTFLDLIFRVLKAKGFNLPEVELRDILFMEAVSTAENYDSRIRLNFGKSGDFWSLAAHSQKVKDGRPVDPHWSENLRGELHLKPAPQWVSFPIEDYRARAQHVVDMSDLYAFAQTVEIRHGVFMKGLGKVYLNPDYLLAEFHLSDLARQYLRQFYLHPAYMDASTLTPFLFDRGENSDPKPYIPIYIESFRALAGLGERCYVHVPKRRGDGTSEQVSHTDLHFYDADGRPLCRIGNLTAKLIRSKELITRLQNLSGETAEAPPPTPVQAAPVETPSPAVEQPPGSGAIQSRDAFESGIRAMIGKLIDKPASSVSLDEGFYDQGLESTDLLKMVRELESQIGQRLYPTLLFEYTNIRELSEYLASLDAPAPRATQPEAPATPKPAAEPNQTLLFKPVWKETPLPKASISVEGPILIFDEDESLRVRLTEKLDPNTRLILVKPGKSFKQQDENHYSIDPKSGADHEQLIAALADADALPRVIFHSWGHKGFSPSAVVLNAHLRKGVYSLFFLARALLARKPQKPIRLLYTYRGYEDKPQPQYAAVAGLAKTLHLENPKLICQSLEWRPAEEANQPDPNQWAAILLKELGNGLDLPVEIRHQGQRRLLRVVEELLPTEAPNPIRHEAVVLITGGAGGLGKIFAEHLASEYKAKLVLTGRSKLDSAKKAYLDKLQKMGGEAIYLPADIADRDSVHRLIEEIHDRFGPLNGVLHAAGVIRDAYAPQKTESEIDEVLAAKVYGTVYLDEETRDEPLDFFVLFSSIAAMFGNPGQADYAAGNAFMDRYAELRASLQAHGRRQGRTVSINWPLWREGGMAVDAHTEASLADSMGMTTLSTEAGIAAFERGLAGAANRFLVAEGQPSRLRAGMGIAPPTETAAQAPERSSVPATGPVAEPVKAPLQRAQPLFASPNPLHYKREQSRDEPIAVIGMAGRYPLAPDLKSFWDNLRNGRDCITEIPGDRWDYREFFDPDRAKGGKKTYSKWGGFLADADKFDPLFFNIPPRAANEMDPQERLFMETVWHTLEDACYTRDSLARARVGVFVGVMWAQYQLFGAEEQLKGNMVHPSSISASIANHVSYFFNFRGPSIALDTMCSSSLTAIHLACESIHRGDSDLAVAGGVNLTLHPSKYTFLSKSQMPSSDGRCRSFGEGGDGYVPGEGVGALLLKPLSKAASDNDHIYGVIRATTLNHGGKTSGYTVPSPKSQGELIETALTRSGLDPRTISYIEAHGTGTSLGDPIEITGLTKAFGRHGLERHSCSVGSVKSNIGHLESAAGISGITKLLLQMRHGQLAPSLHSRTLNPEIDFESSPFYIQQHLAPWRRPVLMVDGEARSFPRRAGISGFGAGGANAHIILEEYEAEAPARRTADEARRLFVLSARDEERLRQQAANLADFLRERLAGNKHASSASAAPKEVLDRLLDIASSLINVDKREIDPGEDLHEYGFDPVSLAEFAARLRASIHMEIEPSLFADFPTLAALAGYLVDPDAAGEDRHPPDLADLAYSLQVGREAMEARLAILAPSAQELLERLDGFLANPDEAEGLFLGNIEHGVRHPLLLSRDSEDIEYLEAILRKGNLEKIARFWVEGANLDWNVLYRNGLPRRISLPTYPFARERCWIPTVETARISEASGGAGTAALHPLIDANVSTLAEQCFRKALRKEEFFLNDHLVQGNIMFPGVAYLEMVRAAGDLAGPAPVRRIQDVIWARPILLDAGSKEIFVGLYPRGEAVAFAVYSRDKGQKQICAQGRLAFENKGAPPVPEPMAIDALRARCPQVREQDELYRFFADMGFGYGPSFRVTRRVYGGAREALAELQLPPEREADFTRFGLHPSLMDGALRTITGIGAANAQTEPVLHIPFALGELQILGAMPQTCFVHATIAEGEASSSGLARFHLDLADKSGRIFLRIRDFSTRAVRDAAAETADSAQPQGETLYLAPAWREEPISASGNQPRTVLVFERETSPTDELERAFGESSTLIRVRSGETFRQVDRDRFEINAAQPEDYRRLLENLHARNAPPEAIIFLWNENRVEPDYAEDEARALLSHLDAQLETGVLALLPLVQAVGAVLPDQKIRCLYAFRGDASHASPHHAAVAGFAKSLVSVNHRFELVSVRQTPELSDSDWAGNLVEECCASSARGGQESAWSKGRRMARFLQPFDPQPANRVQTPLKRGGVYIITGGAGGLGSTFARYLLATYGARLVLSGRSELNAAKRALMEELGTLGGEVRYERADINSYEDCRRLVEAAKVEFGRVDGVFHIAGMLGQEGVLETDRATFTHPLRPKIHGTLNLDLATRDEELDCFLLFSSLSAELGDFGTCNYACANRFMDEFAAIRESARASGKRSGLTLSVNWPLWSGGGMEIPAEEADLYFKFSGMRALETEAGLEIFEQLLSAGLPQAMVARGDGAKIRRVLGVFSMEPAAETSHAEEAEPHASSGDDQASLLQAAVSYLKGVLSEATSLPPERIKPKTPLEKYGIDSIMIMELNKILEKDFKDLPSTLFFEYSNLNGVAGYLVDNLETELRAAVNMNASQTAPAEAHMTTRLDIPEYNSGPLPELGGDRFLQAGPPSFPNEAAASPASEGALPSRDSDAETPIAIIGLSGRYPLAKNLDEFWENLKAGRNCITEIPKDRWDGDAYYHPEKETSGKCYTKWGGFIEGVEDFDPLFFSISPAQAELMDPQERLFLETVWQAMEDAGYTRDSLRGSERYPREIGVFTGCMYQHYSLWADHPDIKAMMSINSYSSIANRVSYFFDFQGPSISLDTACSSSLTAIHMACESIRNGECGVAFAGGINLSIHPTKYLGLSQAMMVGSGDACKSFGDGDGFVPGEGVGAVLLKPLADAIRDHDHIYAVIKGSAMNHGGKTNGFTVPNPNAQADLIVKALERAGVQPEEVDYVESAANGSSLGDPIEVAGLGKAFAGYRPDGQPCPIGSVKSNLGHLEAASGISQLTKVLLQMRHHTLVPSIHSDPPNPNLKLEQSPFAVQKETAPWKPRQIQEEEKTLDLPLIAAISSFGAGGANAHLILEEYKAPEAVGNRDVGFEGPMLFVFSARKKAVLKEQIRNMRAFLREHREISLADFSFTLLLGREAMEERLAIIAENREELIDRLDQALEDKIDGRASFQGNADDGEADESEYALEQKGRERLAAWVADGDLERPADLWVRGLDIDWRALPQLRDAGRLALPTYPFDRKRYWLSPSASDSAAAEPSEAPKPAATLENQPAQSKPAPPPKPETSAADAADRPGNALELRVQRTLTNIIASLLKMDADDLDTAKDLQHYGFDSLTGSKMVNRLQDIYGKKIAMRSLFEASTIQDLTQYLIAEKIAAPGPEPTTGEPAPEPAASSAGDSSHDDEKESLKMILAGLNEGRITPQQAMKLRAQFKKARQYREVKT